MEVAYLPHALQTFLGTLREVKDDELERLLAFFEDSNCFLPASTRKHLMPTGLEPLGKLHAVGFILVNYQYSCHAGKPFPSSK